MTQELPAIVAETAELMDGVKLRSSYSGRGMYGSRCVGFVLDRDMTPLAFFGLLLEAANDMAAEDREEILSVLPEMMQIAQIDSMGLGTILYFPGFYARGFED